MNRIYRIVAICLGLSASWALAASDEKTDANATVAPPSKRTEIREVVKDEAKNPQNRSNVKHLSPAERQALRQQIRLHQATHPPKP